MAFLPFTTEYTKASAGQQVKATGLTVTFSMWQVKLSDNTLTQLVTNGAAFEIGNGLYGYTYSGSLDFTTYYYAGVFHTADTTVQAQDVASAWFNFAQAGDPLQNQVPGSYAAGSAGAALGRIGSGQISVTSIVAPNGAATVYRGYDHYAADGYSLDWTQGAGVAWPNLTNATAVTVTVYGALTSGADAVFTGSLVTVGGSNQKVRLELSAAQTLTLALGAFDFDVAATLANGHSPVLVSGKPRLFTVTH